MKNLILFSILPCFVQLLMAQTKVTDISQSPLFGKVKQVTIYTLRGQNHETPDTKAESERTVLTYDEKGRPKEEKNYNKDGSLRDRFTFECLGDSAIIGIQSDGDGNQTIKYTYKYNTQGIETEFDMEAPEQPKYHMSKIDYKCLLKYDDMGNRISEEQYINKTQLTTKTISLYNNLHQKTESVQESFVYNKSKKTKTIFTYDDKGNQVKADIYDDTGHLTGSSTSSIDKFDNNGNWLIRTSSQNGHNSYQGDFTYVNITKRVIKYY